MCLIHAISKLITSSVAVYLILPSSFLSTSEYPTTYVFARDDISSFGETLEAANFLSTISVISRYASSTLARSVILQCFFITSITSRPAFLYLHYTNYEINWINLIIYRVIFNYKIIIYYRNFRDIEIQANTTTANHYLDVSAFPRRHGTLTRTMSGHFSLASLPLMCLVTPKLRAS